MAQYLVIAHQTADSFELEEALKQRVEADGAAEFTLLVPITYAGYLVNKENGDDLHVVARARRVGDAAAENLNEAGVKVSRVIVGDELPLVALEEELQDGTVDYSEIIFSTLPEQVSRWVRMDQLKQAEHRFGLPVSHVICTPPDYSNVDPT